MRDVEHGKAHGFVRDIREIETVILMHEKRVLRRQKHSFEFHPNHGTNRVDGARAP
ncbi:MAG: hypothetical protein RR998_01690 [Oscillospiraceae bacterium]